MQSYLWLELFPLFQSATFFKHGWQWILLHSGINEMFFCWAEGGGKGLIFISFSSGGSRGGAWGAQVPPLLFGQTEAQRAEKLFGDRPPLSEGLDPALFSGLVVIFQTINDWY